jgi:hypothetical protein
MMSSICDLSAGTSTTTAVPDHIQIQRKVFVGDIVAESANGTPGDARIFVLEVL